MKLIFKGLDRIELNGMNVINIDYSKLENNKNVMMVTTGIVVLKNYKKIGYLKISNDRLFTSLTWGVKKVDNSYIEYCLLNLKVSEEGQKNLIPYNLNSYRNRLVQVLEKLKNTYGIELLGKREVKVLEYNKTIFLKRDIKNYEKCLLFLEEVAPKKLKSITYRGKNREVDIVYIENKSRGYKFYNKSKQLEQECNIKCDKEVLRLEYCIFTKEQICKELGSSNMDLWDDQELETMFKRNFIKDFINPYHKAWEKNINWLIKEGKRIRKIKKSGWILQLITNAYAKNILFDIKQVEIAVKKIDSHNFAKNKKTIYKNIKGIYKKNHILMNELFNIVLKN